MSKIEGQIGKLGVEYCVGAGEGKYYKLHSEDVKKIQKLINEDEIVGEMIKFEIDTNTQKPVNFEGWVKKNSCDLIG